MKIDSAQITSVRKAGLTIYDNSVVTRDTEKCPLSVLTGVRIKRVNFRENIRAFRRDKLNCPLYTGRVLLIRPPEHRAIKKLLLAG